MVRSTRTQKVERLNAAYTLLAQGMTANEVVLRLSQRFGLWPRQSYRYVQEARAMGYPAAPTEALICQSALKNDPLSASNIDLV